MLTFRKIWAGSPNKIMTLLTDQWQEFDLILFTQADLSSQFFLALICTVEMKQSLTICLVSLRLEILYLGGNQLTSVPTELGNLRKLKALNLCDNKIESLPSSLVKLTHLQSLSLHNNRLTLLPVALIKLRNLEELSLRDNPLVVRFVKDMTFNPPSLLELSGRCIKNMGIKYGSDDLPVHLLQYLNSARRCVNPCCKGVYFDARVRHIKFVDFCGKYRLPLEQFLCSPHVDERWEDCSSSSSEDESVPIPRERLRRVLLG